MKYLYVVVLSICLFQFSCYEKCVFGTIDIPNSLFFIVKQEQHKLSDSILNSLKLFYFKDNNKFYLKDFIRGTEEGFNLGILTTREIGFISGENNIKDYFLEYPNGDIDTLYIDYKSLNQKEACNHPCRCCCPLEVVRFNGNAALIDSSIIVQKVYLFIKH